MNDNSLHIRMVTPADAKELLTIYESYVLKTAIAFEYMVPTVEELREQIVHTLTRFSYLATAQGGRIVGYAYVSSFKSWAAYDWAIETSIYADRTYRGGGARARLYKALEDTLRQQNILNLEACIVCPDSESIRLHEKYDYKTVACFAKCDYKMRVWYDMIWMEEVLGGHPKESAPVISVTSEVFKSLF